LLIIKGKGHAVPENTYRIIELVGVSTISWEDAAKNAMEVAIKSLEEMRVAEVVKLDLTIEDGKVATYRARVTTSFKYIDTWWILKDDD
jgi:dodecin